MKGKRVYEVSNLDTGERYFVTGWEEGKDKTDKSAIKEAMKLNGVITMGVCCIVRPTRLIEKPMKDISPVDEIGKMFDSIKEKEELLARIKKIEEIK